MRLKDYGWTFAVESLLVGAHPPVERTEIYPINAAIPMRSPHAFITVRFNRRMLGTKRIALVPDDETRAYLYFDYKNQPYTASADDVRPLVAKGLLHIFDTCFPEEAGYRQRHMLTTLADSSDLQPLLVTDKIKLRY